jgi:hypothetical protein
VLEESFMRQTLDGDLFSAAASAALAKRKLSELVTSSRESSIHVRPRRGRSLQEQQRAVGGAFGAARVIAALRQRNDTPLAPLEVSGTTSGVAALTPSCNSSTLASPSASLSPRRLLRELQKAHVELANLGQAHRVLLRRNEELEQAWRAVPNHHR